ncbi:MAG: hypothetical protein B7X94_06175 [Hydrogenophilales bacterium 17-62-8]|nr:MAG: hypothetical protein B7X94_06175 [Hydrogenophilales bacterium 17-62-8]
MTRDGLSVQSDSGPLSIPPGRNLAVAADGTISQLPDGSQPTGLTTIGRLKLVNPPAADLVRGDDGLFRLKSGEPAAADPAVSLISGALETSNVNVVDAMVNMISLARQFDMQIKLLERAESNDSKASQLMAAN